MLATVRGGVCFLVAIAAVPLAGCFDQSKYLPTSAEFQTALELATTPSAIPADGFSTARITASISADAAPARRTIVFEATTGTFVGSSAPGTAETRSIERTVDTSGAVSVELRSSRNVESSTVTAKVKDVAGVSKAVVVSFTAVAPGNIIRVSGPATAPADGATVSQIVADVAAGVPGQRRTVTFATSLGAFVADPNATVGSDGKSVTVDADGGNRAVVFLRSPKEQVGTAFITARVDSAPQVSASTQLLFTAALPETVLVTTNQPTVEATFTDSVEVKVRLLRGVGTPTQGTVVTFQAVDFLGAVRGIFSDITQSDATGQATADFTPGTGAALGRMTITASAGGVSGTAVVEVVP